ncbi:Uncharacterized protein FWK35_00012973 [Aphis craccivora]|uniref:Uncharacterized protein n=1 Tax=Aphis craccivora TaxID=307492 RepID=A0A6G0YCS4_APHCR|nr:Uncharacterized protein FWK35_00012973 [Aphis craccivora]
MAGQAIPASSTPPPSNDLIDATSFVIDFAARKSINKGLDSSDVFNVSVQIITPSRYLSITIARDFLKDEINTLSKTSYRGENNMLVIESHLHQRCRVLMSRQNLLRLQDMQWTIDESIARKSSVVQYAVMKQTDLIASYLCMNVSVEKSECIEE